MHLWVHLWVKSRKENLTFKSLYVRNPSLQWWFLPLSHSDFKREGLNRWMSDRCRIKKNWHHLAAGSMLAWTEHYEVLDQAPEPKIRGFLSSPVLQPVSHRMPGTAGKILEIIIRLSPETFKTDLSGRKQSRNCGPQVSAQPSRHHVWLDLLRHRRLGTACTQPYNSH